MAAGGARNDRDNNAGAVILLVVLASAVVYALSFLLTRLLSRYRELSADRAGAILIGRPSLLASALVKITGEMSRIPTRDLRAAEPLNAFFFAPALAPGFSFSTLFATHPPLDRRLEQLAELEAAARPAGVKFLDALLGRSKPKQPKLDALFGVTGAAITLEASAGMRPTGQAAVCFKPASGQGFAAASEELHGLLELAVKEAGSTLAVTDDRYGYRWVVLVRPRDGGPGHRRPPGQLDPRAARLRPPAALLGVRLRRRSRDGGSTSSTCTSGAPSTRSRRWAASAGTTSWSCGSRPPWRATCRSSRSSPAGSPSGDSRSD